jgi:hypothetical protein
MRLRVLCLMVAVLGLSSGCASGAPRSAIPLNGQVSSSPLPDSWSVVTPRLTGRPLRIPPTWAVRADEPPFFAAWPDWTGGVFDPETQLDGVQIETTASFQTRSEFDPRRSVLANGISELRSQGMTVSAPTTGMVLTEPATMVVGRRGTWTGLLVVSHTYVVRANIFSDAPQAGETTSNVMGVLRSIGLTGAVPTGP